jgi:hypothetical protein
MIFGSVATATAQHSQFGIDLSAHAIPVFTEVDPIPGGRSLSEIRLVQPVAMIQAHAFGDRLRLIGGLDFEGWTLPDGELTPGAWGEGFMDRRHPHTYVHELMLSSDDLFRSLDGRLRLSLSLGKGFVAFGTDDPMSRPTLRFPVNHHFSQILERAVGIVGAAWGPITLEGSLFNGDEPEFPGEWPRVARFGDSWAVRGTVRPLTGLELQSSRAGVHSPEHRAGAGVDQVKWSVSARWERPIHGLPAYAMVEWAITSEADGFFVYHSILAEAQGEPGRHRFYYRFERTERPEEERLSDLFRSRRPILENSILGITRWTLHTAGYGYSVVRTGSGLGIEPFVEATRAEPMRVGNGLFLPSQFYHSKVLWSGSVGVRIDWRMRGHRMGRYSEPMDQGQGMDMGSVDQIEGHPATRARNP